MNECTLPVCPLIIKGKGDCEQVGERLNNNYYEHHRIFIKNSDLSDFKLYIICFLNLLLNREFLEN